MDLHRGSVEKAGEEVVAVVQDQSFERRNDGAEHGVRVEVHRERGDPQPESLGICIHIYMFIYIYI